MKHGWGVYSDQPYGVTCTGEEIERSASPRIWSELQLSVCANLLLVACKLIKQRCREIFPSMHVFLDVEDLASGSGTKEVDHSRCILVFAMPVYF